MKAIFPFLICALSFLSCSKNNDNTSVTDPVDPPGLLADTLSGGWTKHTPGFADIGFVNTLVGYGAGGSGISKTIDGGITWSVVDSTNWCFNVSCSPDGKAFFAGGLTKIISTADGGITFTTSQSGFLGGRITDTYFPDANNGYAVGNTGFYQTIDGGISWNHVTPATGLSFTNPYNSYYSLFFVNNTTGWVASGANIYRTDGSINNWLAATFDQAPSNAFVALSAPGNNIIYTVTASGQVYKSIDGAVNFSLLTTLPGSQEFPDIHFVDDQTGYATYGKKIFKTSDAGISWQAVVSMGEQEFIEVHFTDAHHGWACTAQSLLIYNQ